MKINWQSRKLEASDQEFLWDMLYIALWDAPDEPRRARSVLNNPKVRRLVEAWGRAEDFGLVALDPQSMTAVGAIWIRLDGYDRLDTFGCDYPCLGIAIDEAHQNKGAGNYLMSGLIKAVSKKVEGVRLGVNPKNTHAIRLYEKLGFREYALGHGNYPQMKLKLKTLEQTSGCND